MHEPAQTGKPTILIIIGAYLPGTLAGGPVRTTSNMVEWLGDRYRFLILTVDRDFSSDVPYEGIVPGRWYAVGKAMVRYLTPPEQSLTALTRIIRDTAHDMVYLDSVLATMSVKYLLLRRLGLVARLPLILAPRGNLGAGAVQLKSVKKRIYFRFAHLFGLYRNLYWHASSADECDAIQQYFRTPTEFIQIIPNLPNPALLHFDSHTRPAKQAGRVRMVTLSRISRKKNIHFMLRALRDFDYAVDYDLYGPLEDAHYWQECQTIIAQLPDHISVSYRGSATFNEVIKVLSGYHLFVLPTLNENFGHVILEALCAGCALLISDQTPWRELQAKGVGWDLPLQIDIFLDALSQFAALDDNDFRAMSDRARTMGVSYVQNEAHLDALRNYFELLLAQNDQ
jgi:glycosyltransferase involved in cell wall biosynthesis